MTKAGKLIRHIETGITTFFNGDGKTQELINGVCNLIIKCKLLVDSNQAIALTKLLPNGIGDVTLQGIRNLINKAIPDIEIAKRASDEIAIATKGMTDVAQIVATVIPILIKEINTLPANQQGKHLEEICVAILSKVLTIPLDELELLVKAAILKVKEQTAVTN